MAYKDIYDGWKADPEGFWMKAAGAITAVTGAMATMAATRPAFAMTSRSMPTPACGTVTMAGITAAAAMARPVW